MTRQEAAQFLGVSVSTVDRLASQGRLTRGRVRGKTRPRTDFDAGELERLRKQLGTPATLAATETHAASELPGGVPQQVPRAESIGFRLDPYYAGRLRAEGERQGMSAGEYARRLVIRALEQDHDGLLRRELSGLRQSLGEMFFLVLSSGMGVDEDQAAAIAETMMGGS